MSFVSKNPRFRSMILTDLAAGSIANPPSGSHRLINREGTLSVKDASGLETAIGAGGTVDRITQTAHGFVVGEMLYYTGSNYAKAKADAANTAEIVGMVSRVIDVNSFEITLEGKVTGLAGLVAGSVYFLSASTAGTITATEPNVLGQISLPLGVAISTSAFYVKSSRGAIVGGTNARTEISLSNNASTNTQLVTAYDAGEMTGWVVITGTTSYRFYVAVQFSKNAAGSDYNVSYQTSGETPPAGFSIQYSANYITVTLPNVAGFSSAKLNYALNAPAVGATFPLAVDASVITAGTVAAARLPVVVPGTSAGVVAAAGLPGNTTGNAIAAGYVGEEKTGSINASVNTLRDNVAVISSYTPGAGIWLITGVACLAVGTIVSGYATQVGITNNSTTFGLATSIQISAAPTSSASVSLQFVRYLVTNSTDVVRLLGVVYGSSGNYAWTPAECSFKFIRIA